MVVLHYKDKRISIPIYRESTNITEVLYKDIDKFEKNVLKSEQNWEKNSYSKIICFQTRKEQDSRSERLSDSDLKMDILLSLVRLDHPDRGCELPDITKYYKYMEVSPFYLYYDPFIRTS